MKLFAFILFLLPSPFLFSQIIPFTTNEEGNIIVIGKLNDSVRANLIFDTGGGLNVISNKFFQKIKTAAVFQHYFTGFRHDGDRLDLEVYKIPSLTIGEYKLQNVLFGVTKILDEWNMDGIVSLINFETIPITFDYRQKQLRIETKASLTQIATRSQSLPIKLHQFGNISLDIFVPVCINAQATLDMEFDTGSLPEDILINSKYLAAFNIDTLKTRNITFITPFSRTLLRRYIKTIDSVRYCGLQYESLKNIQVEFKENMIYDGIIGAGYFKNLPFTIDIVNKRILVQNK